MLKSAILYGNKMLEEYTNYLYPIYQCLFLSLFLLFSYHFYLIYVVKIATYSCSIVPSL
jgi:hypothetical protein